MKNVLLVVLSMIFSLVVIEGFLMWRPEFQASVPSDTLVFCSEPSELAQAHELLGWTAVPDSAYFKQPSEADGWSVHIYNANGFRDLFDSGNEQVIVLGDSFTEGWNADNDRTFPYLLDLWNPDMAFRNFAVGGYGIKQSLSVYEAMSSRISHELVILGYFLGNELRDSLRDLSRREQDGRPESPDAVDGTSWYEALREIHLTVRQNVRTYNLLNSFLRPGFGVPDLSDEQIAQGAKITGDLLAALAEKVHDNGSDLLVVILPAFSQMNNYRDPEEAVRQRALIREIADQRHDMYLIEMSNIIAQAGVDGFYGINDKHFSPYGYYLTAKAIHDWINFEWPRGHRSGRQAPPFQSPRPPLDPDCALIPEYRESFANPAVPGVSGRPSAAAVASAPREARSGSPDFGDDGLRR